MAQHDYVIDNQSFPATRTDLNNVLQAIVSNNSGTSAPSTTFANQIWYDTATNTLFIRNEDNDANIPLMQFDQSADVAATLATVIDILDASGTDQAGTSLTIRGGAGTGTGAGGSIILQTADGAGSTGSSVNSHATAVTVLDNGRVGIGTTTAEATLDVMGNSDSVAALKLNGGNDNHGFHFYTTNSEGDLAIKREVAGTQTEVTRIHRSDGDITIGKTATAIGTAGLTLQVDGFFSATRDGSHCAGFNRLSDDGNIVEIRRDGSIMGLISCRNSTVMSIGTGDTGLEFTASSDAIIPTNPTTASLRDNAIDFGTSSFRFDDIFATNGTIQTSDQNEKQNIASLTSAEITAATAISKLFKTYKWKDKVAAKGDAARTHTGVIAQDVQQAMTDAGLDATKYAFWCSDTWWEKDVEVAAVEAVEAKDAVYKDGELISEAVEAVEAKDAYIRTDTYETADAAPEGATERTRLGIRYPELLAFVGAATEQRLADIETRLAALEG